jgi:hypothetical protein
MYTVEYTTHPHGTRARPIADGQAWLAERRRRTSRPKVRTLTTDLELSVSYLRDSSGLDHPPAAQGREGRRGRGRHRRVRQAVPRPARPDEARLLRPEFAEVIEAHREEQRLYGRRVCRAQGRVVPGARHGPDRVSPNRSENVVLGSAQRCADPCQDIVRDVEAVGIVRPRASHRLGERERRGGGRRNNDHAHRSQQPHRRSRRRREDGGDRQRALPAGHHGQARAQSHEAGGRDNQDGGEEPARRRDSWSSSCCFCCWATVRAALICALAIPTLDAHDRDGHGTGQRQRQPDVAWARSTSGSSSMAQLSSSRTASARLGEAAAPTRGRVLTLAGTAPRSRWSPRRR